MSPLVFFSPEKMQSIYVSGTHYKVDSSKRLSSTEKEILDFIKEHPGCRKQLIAEDLEYCTSTIRTNFSKMIRKRAILKSCVSRFSI